MKINLDYFDENNEFNLKANEEKLIEYIYSINEGKDIENIIKESLNDNTILGLSNIRKNLVYSYDFEPNSTVLEIGAHLGELTGALCEKCNKVIAVEPNKIRAEAIARRYSSEENLEIVVGKLQDIKFREKFDYITLFGIIEYAQKIFDTEKPALDLILYCKELLKTNGKLLIATDNKFALKSYVGEIDECTGITFDSVTGYKSSDKQYKLGKKHIENILDEADVKFYKFFYPLPDYKLPSLIFTDSYLPSCSKINGYFPYYTEDSNIFFSEVDAYDAIIREDKKMFPFFSNSYFIVASQNEFYDDTRYVSFNNYRKEEYQLMTKIRENVVEKTSINNKSKKHIDRIKNNIKSLKNENIIILDEIRDEKIVSKFVKEKLASQLISDNEKKPDEILKILNKYRDEITKLSVNYDEREQTVIEKYIPDIDKNILPKFKYLKNGYWDMILKNCFIIDDKCVFFDQEWIEKNVPMEFLLYRSIVNVEKIRDKIEKYELFEKMQIKEFIDIFQELDRRITGQIMDKTVFGFYQKKHNNPIYDNFKLQDKNKKLMEQNNKVEKELEEKINQIEIFEERNKCMIDENAELKNKLNIIYNSRSWKIAKGLSKIKKLIKK